ncbi:unnamed protein product [Symbiodinium natans]|uniref:Uncharacterized protein n=1 Tax=Symbiodinium natans TaxID=878477 RepID=A0A812QC52_9DINO|nr:unnamed protein product [Symbiodinium natans]
MAVIEEKLSKALLLPSEPHLISQGSSASIISRHSKPINSKISKPETPEISSARLSDFDDIDQMLGERVMKSAMKNSSWKRSGTHLGASMGLTSMAMSAKSVSIANILPQTIPSASDEDGPGVSLAKAQDLGISTSDQAHQIIPPNVPETPKSNASNSHAASLSNVFRHREVQLIPVSTATNGTSLRIPSDVPESHSHGGVVTAGRRLLIVFECWTRFCGLTPLVQRWIENPKDQCEDLDPRMMFLSKAYHSLVLLLSLGCIALGASNLSVCSAQPDVDCTGWPATDVAVALGAALAIASCGGLRHYFKSAQMQILITEHLKASIHLADLENQFWRQKVADGFTMVFLWMAILAVRIWMYAFQLELHEELALKIVPHAFASAALLGACYLQVACWRGVSLTIVAFARSLLGGLLDGQEARAKWREMTSCMRQASRTYQLTSAALALTTMLVSFTALFDMHQGLLLHMLPNLVVAGSLLSSLYVAASTTAHCTRLPSLVSMLDGDDEESELEYMNLSLFLSLSESGFFMWDTRVTLGVLQKFVYFSTAIVGTIGFQLNVLHF